MKIELRRYDNENKTFDYTAIEGVSMYTGAKDKNGKKIYTGDIIGFSDKNKKIRDKYIGIVKIMDCSFKIDMIYKSDEYKDSVILGKHPDTYVMENIYEDGDIISNVVGFSGQ